MTAARGTGTAPLLLFTSRDQDDVALKLALASTETEMLTLA